MNYFMKIIEKYIGKDKNITNLIVILIIGVIIVIAGSVFWGEDRKDKLDIAYEVSDTGVNKDDTLPYEQHLKLNLEKVLSSIEGVGKVSAMITFESSSEMIPAIETKSNKTLTSEADNQGGKREVEQIEEDEKILILNKQDGDQQPLILKELKPKVKGVIIVAEGVEDPGIKRAVYDAAKTVLGIKAHKVKIFKKSSN